MEVDVKIPRQLSYISSVLNVPLLEIVDFQYEHTYSDITEMNQIICILTGKGNISSDIYPKRMLNENEIIFFPVESRFDIHLSADSKIIIIRLDPFQTLYGSYSVEELFQEYQKYIFRREAGILKIKEILLRYLDNLILYMKHDLFNELFYEIKIKELLFIFYGYYDKKELCDFFKPILNKDFIFASFILNNWSKVKTAKQLAELSTYCETGFNKKFKKVFGATPYKWLNKKRATKILYDITNSNKSFKLIAEEYKFNSQQQFNDYCIRNFNKPPGAIRKR